MMALGPNMVCFLSLISPNESLVSLKIGQNLPKNQEQRKKPQLLIQSRMSRQNRREEKERNMGTLWLSRKSKISRTRSIKMIKTRKLKMTRTRKLKMTKTRKLRMTRTRKL